MSQDEMSIRVVIDPSQFREELGRLRRDLEDQNRIEMDKLRGDVSYPPQTPTVVEIRERVTGFDQSAMDRVNKVIGDVEELKRGLGIPAEFARLTPDRLQDMVREAFRSGGFKDIFERDPQLADDIAWVVERGVARHGGEQMQEFMRGDPQTYGALQKILDTMMRKHPYASGQRMRMLRGWVDESIRQMSIGEVAVTEPQDPGERRAYMSMGHRATQLDVQRVLGEMQKQAGLEFRLPFGDRTRQLDVFAQYVAKSITTGESITAVLGTEVKASGQSVGGTGGVASQMSEQIVSVMQHLKGVYNLGSDKELREFLMENRRVKGRKGTSAGVVKMVLASFKDVSLNQLKTSIVNHLVTMGGDEWKQFYADMILGDPKKAGIEIVTDITPVELQKRFAELWDEGRRDVEAYGTATAEFIMTDRGKEWTEERIKKYNPDFSSENLDEIQRALAEAAGSQGTGPERVESVYEALSNLLGGEGTGRPHTFIEGVRQFLDVPAAVAFPGVFARAGRGRGAVRTRTLGTRLPGYLPGLAETIAGRSAAEEAQVSRLVGGGTRAVSEIEGRASAGEDWAIFTKALFADHPEALSAQLKDIIVTNNLQWGDYGTAMQIFEREMRERYDRTPLEEKTRLMGSGGWTATPQEALQIAYSSYVGVSEDQGTLRLLEEGRDAGEMTQGEFEEAVHLIVEGPASPLAAADILLKDRRMRFIEQERLSLFRTTGIGMEFDPKEHLAGMKKVAAGLGFKGAKGWKAFEGLIEAKKEGKLGEHLKETIGSVMAVVGATLKGGEEAGVFSKEQQESLSKLMAGTPQFWELYQKTPRIDPDTGKPEAVGTEAFYKLVRETVSPTDLPSIGKELNKMLKNPEINAMLNPENLSSLHRAAISVKRMEQATMDLEPAFGGSLRYWT